MPVVASCRCGQRFLAQDYLLGRQGPCPGCGAPLLIPTADEGELRLAETRPQPTPPYLPQSQSAPQYVPQPSPLQPAGRSHSSASSSGSDSQFAWILSIGGGLAALVLLIIAVVALSQSSGGKRAT